MMDVNKNSHSDFSEKDFTVTFALDKDDIESLMDGKGTITRDNFQKEESEESVEVGFQICFDEEITHFSPNKNVEVNSEDVFDDALDALMMLTMAYEDLERKVEDNESYPEAHSRNYSTILRDVRDEYPVQEAIDTFSYYDKIRREVYL